MTPKEKAEGLVWKYYNTLEHTISEEYSKKDWEIAKQCALIAVDEIFFALKYNLDVATSGSVKYWQEVKQEIEKL